jgi:hypothetical protein
MGPATPRTDRHRTLPSVLDQGGPMEHWPSGRSRPRSGGAGQRHRANRWMIRVPAAPAAGPIAVGHDAGFRAGEYRGAAREPRPIREPLSHLAHQSIATSATTLSGTGTIAAISPPSPGRLDTPISVVWFKPVSPARKHALRERRWRRQARGLRPNIHAPKRHQRRRLVSRRALTSSPPSGSLRLPLVRRRVASLASGLVKRLPRERGAS